MPSDKGPIIPVRDPITVRALIWANIIFCVSRVCFYAAGVRFDAQSFLYFYQFVDPLHFNDNFMESLVFLHCQPPLFNALVGLAYKFLGLNYYYIFKLAYPLLGVVLLNSMILLMLRLNVRPLISFVLALLFMISPEVIIYENWLFYAYPEAVLLLLSVVVLQKYLTGGGTKYGLALFLILATLCLIRATYHPVWLLALIILLGTRVGFKKILRASAIPLIIVLSLYLKNYALFGSFSMGSTWFGLQLAQMAMQFMPPDERQALAEEGKISVVTADEMGQNLLIGDIYAEQLDVEKTGIPILDDIKRPLSDLTNLNSLAVLGLSKIYRRDAVYALTHHPQYYVKSVMIGALQYFFPGPVDYAGNRRPIATYEKSYNILFRHLNTLNSGAVYSDQVKYHRLKWDWLSVLCYGLIICVFLLVMGSTVGKILQSPHSVYGTMLLYMLISILYVSFVTIGFGYYANSRYRFALDPLYVVLFGIFLSDLCNSFRRQN